MPKLEKNKDSNISLNCSRDYSSLRADLDAIIAAENFKVDPKSYEAFLSSRAFRPTATKWKVIEGSEWMTYLWLEVSYGSELKILNSGVA